MKPPPAATITIHKTIEFFTNYQQHYDYCLAKEQAHEQDCYLLYQVTVSATIIVDVVVVVAAVAVVAVVTALACTLKSQLEVVSEYAISNIINLKIEFNFAVVVKQIAIDFYFC